MLPENIMSKIFLDNDIDNDVEQPKSNDEDEEEIQFSKWLKRLQCPFPLFTEESILAYDNFCIKSVNPVSLAPAAFVYFAIIACQSGLLGFENINVDESNVVGLRLASILLYVFCFLFFSLYCTVHFLRLTGRDEISMVMIARLKKWLPLRLEELMMLTGVGAFSSFLLARVLKGQCLAGTTVWQQQTCNPYANSGGLPTELVYPLYMIPLFVQLIMKSVSVRLLTVGYLLVFGVVAFCLFYSKSTDYFVLINSVFFMNLTFEVTRIQRVKYVEMLKVQTQQKIVLAQIKQEQVIQEVVRAQVLLLHRAEDQKLLKESEAVQLRSLMGNVAHDLKTPLVRKEGSFVV